MNENEEKNRRGVKRVENTAPVKSDFKYMQSKKKVIRKENIRSFWKVTAEK